MEAGEFCGVAVVTKLLSSCNKLHYSKIWSSPQLDRKYVGIYRALHNIHLGEKAFPFATVN